MRLSLTRRGWGFVLGAAVFGLAGIFVELRDFWYFPVFLAAVPVVAVLVVVLLRSTVRLEVRLIATDPTPSVGSTVVLTAVIKHRLPIALATRVNWELGDVTASADVYLPRGGSERISQVWSAARRGPTSVGIPTVLIIDPLGVATAQVTCDKRASLEHALVLPRLLDATPEFHDSDSHGDAGAQPAAFSEQSAEAPGGALRKYHPGDVKRMVDWKQSARQRELLVRIAESADASVRRITIVTEPAAYRSADEFEVAVSEAATRGVAWLRRGDAVQLVVDDDPPIECASEDELLRRLAYVNLGSGAHAAR